MQVNVSKKRFDMSQQSWLSKENLCLVSFIGHLTWNATGTIMYLE